VGLGASVSTGVVWAASLVVGAPWEAPYVSYKWGRCEEITAS
jgi:hypothetical protein